MVVEADVEDEEEKEEPIEAGLSAELSEEDPDSAFWMSAFVARREEAEEVEYEEEEAVEDEDEDEDGKLFLSSISSAERTISECNRYEMRRL